VLIDSRSVPSDTVVDCDVCIVGAGAAGIAMAREFAGGPFRVCVLESGGLAIDNETQALNQGECVGLGYELETTRARCFGGSTRWWGGFCRPFEPYHFERRSWVPDSGWPFGLEQLEPFYRRALDLCGFDDGGFDVTAAVGRLSRARGHKAPLADGHFIHRLALIKTGEDRWFGQAFRQELAASGNLKVFLYANVIGLETNDDGRRLTAVRVATLTGGGFQVTARVVVLAAGAVENARLLLAANDRVNVGLGNQHDLVGRYFMEHATFVPATIAPGGRAGPSPLCDSRYAVLNLPLAVELNPSPALQRKLRLLDCAIYINAVFRGENSNGVHVLKKIHERMWRGYARSLSAREALQLAAGSLDVGCFVLGWFSQARCLVSHYQVRLHLEQSPNRDSRVLLSDRRDRLGQPMVRLDWRLTELDRDTVRRTTAMLAREAGRRGWGRMSIALPAGGDPSFPAPDWIWHHIGTTRMHPDPAQGVVDADCRVHSLENLFIAGSSVFPTAGNHCPTLTILALGLRLADHLKQCLRRQVRLAA
jgi:choline dehydrogenase-like flavoprotein